MFLLCCSAASVSACILTGTLRIEAASWIIKSSAAIFRRSLTIKIRQLETVEISSLVKDSVIMDVTDFSEDAEVQRLKLIQTRSQVHLPPHPQATTPLSKRLLNYKLLLNRCLG